MATLPPPPTTSNITDIQTGKLTPAWSRWLAMLYAHLGGPENTAGGDLSGLYPDPEVVSIKGQPLGTVTPTSGNVLIGDGNAWQSKPISGDVSLTSAGVTTVSDIPVDKITGVVPIIKGGTGLTNYTKGDVIYFNGSTLAKAAGNILNTAKFLRSTGSGTVNSTTSFAAVRDQDLEVLAGTTAGQVLEYLGGTAYVPGIKLPTTSLAQGDIWYCSTGAPTLGTMTNLAKSTTATRYLSNQGTNNNPSWNQINLGNGVTGTTSVTNGGTGVASVTAYAVLCGGTSSTSALQSIASVGTSGYVLTSNGAAALPTFQASGNTSSFSRTFALMGC